MIDKTKEQLDTLNHNEFRYLCRKMFISIYPPLVVDTICKLHKLNPGYDGKAIKEALDHTAQPLFSKFIVFAGVPGNGKTVAACLMGIDYYYVTRIFPYRQEVTDRCDKKHPELIGERLLKKFASIEKNDGDYENIEFPRVNVKFEKSLDLIMDFDKKYEKTDTFKSNDLIIIDDMGADPTMLYGNPTYVFWDYMIDYRYSNKLSTIITTNLNKNEFQTRYQGRVMDRLNEVAITISVADGSFRC